MTNPKASQARLEEELRFIHILTQQALGLESLSAFWPLLEESLVRFFECDRATLFMVGKTELRSMFARGLDHNVIVKLGDGVAGAVALSGKILVVNDPDKDSRFNPSYDRVTGYKTLNLACAPFSHEGSVIGVVELLSKPGGFTEDDARSLDGFSTHIGIVIAKLLADQENRELKRRLERVSRLATMGMLAGSAAREVGGPLSAVREMTLRILAELTPGPSAEELRQRLELELLCLEGAVRKLAAYAERVAFNPAPVSVSRACETALALVQRQARLQDVHVSVNMPSDLPDALAGAEPLQQVFLCLVENALEAMPTGGRLKVSGAVRDGVLHVDFQDDGEGIDPADFSRVFEPFFTTRRQRLGAGLGLCISKDLVERFGGRLSSRSEGRGRGAVFSVELLVAKP